MNMAEPSSSDAIHRGFEDAESASMNPSIARLFPELLVEIIWSYVNDFRPPSYFEWESTPGPWKTWAYPLIQVTGVCRRWRDIALSYPRFWSQIVISSPDCVREWLLRSKRTPLTILMRGFDIPEVEEVESYRLVLEQVSRVRVMELRTTPHIMQLLLSSDWVNLPAPLLRRTIVFPNLKNLDDRILDPEVFVPLNAPCLEWLDLALDEETSWDDVRLPSTLKKFDIAGIFATESLDNMFSAIEALTELERLNLYIWTDAMFPPRPQKFNLPPRLQCFDLHNLFERHISVAAFASLLDCFSVPPSTDVEIFLDLADLGPSASDLRMLATSIARAFHGEHGLNDPILSLAVRLGSSDEIWLDARTSVLPFHLLVAPSRWGDQPPSRKLLVRLEWAVLEYAPQAISNDLRALFEDFCGALPLRDVQILILNFDFDNSNMCRLISGIAMHTSLGGMASLKAMRIYKLSGRELLCFLTGAAGDSSLVGCRTAFPSLATLELQDIAFSDTDLRLLAHWLQARRARDASITNLAIRTCYGVGTGDIEVLKDLVVELEYEP